MPGFFYCLTSIFSGKKQKEAVALIGMVGIHGADHRDGRVKAQPAFRGILNSLLIDPGVLCQKCSRLLTHGRARLANCPFETMPGGKHCRRPCYAGEYRVTVNLALRYFGMKLIKSGRPDLFIRYFFP
ncbi:MAG: hypothetical protein A2W25_04720 [candidate division Zixibacteria bacterium RBG_16_53_22]|nr:MAG: hypothetical protein A2W25_04720 [candidate division Zixibacteria bacterium RBG_16_53_22]